MGEVLWVSFFGLALAWLQSNSREEAPPEAPRLPVDDEWTRWEEEIHDWRDQT